jgi:hypothetical protein
VLGAEAGFFRIFCGAEAGALRGRRSGRPTCNRNFQTDPHMPPFRFWLWLAKPRIISAAQEILGNSID